MSIVNYLAPALIGILTMTTGMVTPAWAMELTQQVSPDSSQLLRAAERLKNQGELSQAAELLRQATLAAQKMADANLRDDLLRQISVTYLQLENSTDAIAVTHAMSDATLPPESCCIPLRTQAETAIATYFFDRQQDEELSRFLQTIPNNIRHHEVVLGTIRAGAEQGQIDRAIALLPLITNPQQTLSAQHTLIQRYGQAGLWNAGVALAQQMTDPQERSGALYTLALTATQSGRYAQALTLATQIELPQSRISALANLSLAFSHVGDTAQAHRLMEQAYTESQSIDPRPQPYWIDQFAQIRAYDRAIALLEQMEDSYTQSEGRLYLARAYWQSDRLNDALELVKTIPDGQLEIPGGYPDPKIELINDILERAVVLGQSAVVDQGVALLSPLNRAWTLLDLSQRYSANAPIRLDQAFEVALNLQGVQQSPSAKTGLLLVIARQYWAIGDREQAQAAAQQAFEVLSIPAIDSIETVNTTVLSLREIALFAHSLGDTTLTQNAITKTQAIISSAAEQDPSSGFQLWLALTDTCDAVGDQTCALDSAEQAQAIIDRSESEALRRRALADLSLRQSEQTDQAIETLLPILLNQKEPERSLSLQQQALSLANETRPALAFRVASAIPNSTAQVSAWASLTAYYAAQNNAAIAEQAFTELLTTIDRGWNPTERDHWVGLSIQQLIHPVPESESSLQYELAVRLLPAMASHQARASAGLLIAQAAFAEGDQLVAQSALAEAVNASQQKTSLSWSTTLWENFQAALRFEDLTLADAMAQQFDNPFYKINALRHVAHRYGRRGEADSAIAALAQARQTARTVEDLPTRDQLMRAIATHQHWIER